MMKRTLFAVLLLSVCGCAPNPEELDRLTKEDPHFKQMIQARDQIHSQVHLIKQDLLEKKKGMDSQVEKLRKEYDAYAKAQNTKSEKYEQTLETYRNGMKRDIETAGVRLQAKLTELDGYQKTMADVKKVLHEGKTMNLSGQEKEKWEERMMMLAEKIRPLTEEIQELKLQIQLNKRKISFLR